MYLVSSKSKLKSTDRLRFMSYIGTHTWHPHRRSSSDFRKRTCNICSLVDNVPLIFFNLPQDDFSISELRIWVLQMVYFLSDFSQRDQACSSVLLLSHLACCKYIPLSSNRWSSWAAIHKQYVIEMTETE